MNHSCVEVWKFDSIQFVFRAPSCAITMTLRALQRATGLLYQACAGGCAPSFAATSSAVLGRSGCSPATALRSFRSAPPSFSLSNLIAQELEYEAEQKVTESALQAVPDGWSLLTKPSETLMKLSKKLGSEEIVVSVSTVDQEDSVQDDGADEGEGGEAAYPVTFSVDVVKDGQVLQFQCLYVENDQADPAVQDVAFFLKSEEENVGKMYEGPRFAELDETLQSAFNDFVVARGVDANLGQYICRLVYDKEQEDYVAWLGKVKTFVS